MRIPDVNVLLNSINSDSQHQTRAVEWMESSLSGNETIGFPVISLIGFIRISTSRSALETPLAPTEALDQVDSWLVSTVATVIHPGPRHLAILRSLLEHTGTAGNLTTDAHLAALALEQRARLATFDGDFHRFPSLKLDYLQ